MKKIALTLSALAIVSTASFAQAALISTTDITADQAKALVQDKGAIVLSTAPGIYDRYVANGSFCATNEDAKSAFVATSDSSHSKIGYTCEVGSQEG